MRITGTVSYGLSMLRKHTFLLNPKGDVMSHLYRIVFAVALVLCATVLFLQQGMSVRQDTGTFEVSPATYTAGQFGTWTTTYTVGARQIQQGGTPE